MSCCGGDAEMLWQTLLGMAAAYVAWLVIAVPVRKLLKLDICAICAAVSSTWIVLLALYYLGYKIDPLLPAILMGQSVTGLMYMYERRVRKTKFRWPLAFRIFFPLAGTLVVYAAVSRNMTTVVYTSAAVVAAAAIILALAIAAFGKFNKQVMAVIRRLEECCG